MSLNEEAQQILTAATDVLAGTSASPLRAGLSERALETPWVASYFKGGERVIDIGFTMSSLDYLGLLLELRRKHDVTIEAIDIVKPERVARRYPAEWLSEVMAVPVTIGDVRTLELPVARYDIATCISTIEHIGFDEATHADPKTAFARSSTREGVDLHRDASVNHDVIAQLGRALKPGGVLLISVPMGRGGPVLLQDSLGLYCAQWEYEAVSWREIVEAPGFDVIDQRFGRLEADGTWRWVDGPADLADQTSYLKPHAAGVALVALRRR
jgi:SAM-dependent methyltransferase